jgi:hypothetical protein
MSNLKTKAQLLSKLYYSFARWKIWGRFMKNYRFPPLSELRVEFTSSSPGVIAIARKAPSLPSPQQ